MILWTAGTVIVTGVALGWGEYWKQLGKNVATKQDLAELTRIAKEIESQISSDVWDRQKRWELKRDVVFDATKKLVDVENALRWLGTSFTAATGEGTNSAVRHVEKMKKDLEEWKRADQAFDAMLGLILVVCRQDTAHVLMEYAQFLQSIASSIFKDDFGAYGKSEAMRTKKSFEVRWALRVELGMESDPTSQSNESSAAPNPAGQVLAKVL